LSNKELIDVKKEISKINNGLKIAFEKVGDEFSEHLDTINANTSELSAIAQILSGLEQKIEKLNERIDELTISQSSSNSFQTINLSVREQEVFASLYTSDVFLSVKAIARLVGRESSVVSLILKRLISKKIPLIKNIIDNEDFYAIDSSFKQIQARENIVHLNKTVMRDLYN